MKEDKCSERMSKDLGIRKIWAPISALAFARHKTNI
jgi:hypothetical protein